MEDRFGNPIKLHYSEREAYDLAIAICRNPDGLIASLAKKGDLAVQLVDCLERLGRMRVAQERLYEVGK
jgi:hypothetical protein